MRGHSDRDAQAKGAGSGQTLSELAVERLRSDIMRGAFAPGAKLRIEELSALSGVGASPLREALSRLEASGLVVINGRRGFRVADVSVEDLLDLTATRKWVEGKALRSSIENADDIWEARLLSAHHLMIRVRQSDGYEPGVINEEWEERHRAFHSALISGCESKRLLDYSAILYDQADRYRRMACAVASLPGKRDIATEHEGIYEYALARDADRACKALEQHLDLTRDTILAFLADNPAAASSQFAVA
jgi:DNA-binding GntR family transcriptional regulator